MNGPEKSDPAIVAMKPTNKAEGPSVARAVGEPYAAESVERRAGTKGNAGQQSTRRTQSRESVSQALERIRRVARERKKERFTTLFQHINVDLLEEAFYALKENAAPGVDRLRWRDYEADLERKLEDLHGRVQRGAYRALPAIRLGYVDPPGRQCPIRSALDPVVQILQITLEVCLVVLPRQPIHAGCSIRLKIEERLFEQIGVDMMEERGEPLLLPFPCDFPYALQRL